MSITTVRPNGVLKTGNWAPTGAADNATAQADASDASYSTCPGGGGNPGIGRLYLGDIALSAGQRIAAVRRRIRAKGSGASTRLLTTMYDPISAGETPYYDYYTNISSTVWTDLTGSWNATAPDGSEWTQEIFNRITAQEQNNSGSGSVSIAALYVDVDIRSKIVATVSSPTGVVTDTSRPTVSLGYTDPDGESPTAMRVKVFSAAQYGAGGFDPDTATPVWDSAEVPYADSIQVGTNLPNGTTYRAYVKVAKSFNGATWYGDWAYSGFSLSLTAPAAPTVTPTYSSVTKLVNVAITGTAPPGGTVEYNFLVERSDADDPTWYVIPGGYVSVPVGGPFTASVTDRLARRGVLTTYRVTPIAVVSGNDVAGPPATGTVTPPLVNEWTLRTVDEVGDGEDYFAAPVVGEPEVTVPESLGVFRPLGRKNAVVLSSGLHGEDGTLQLVIRDDWDTARAVLLSTDPVLVQDPFGGHKYVRITSRDWRLLGAATAPRRPVDVGYVEIDDPTGDLATSVLTSNLPRFTLGTGDARSTLGPARL